MQARDTSWLLLRTEIIYMSASKTYLRSLLFLKFHTQIRWLKCPFSYQYASKYKIQVAHNPYA